jgi:glycosyltransferase involved in cell wall biosynthesis
MRILHVIPSLSMRTGGPPVAVVESARALRQCGIDSTIVASDMAAPASAGTRMRVVARDLPPGAELLDVRLHPASPPGRLVFSPSMFRELLRIAHAYDVVHVHSLFLFPQFAAYLSARRAGVPYIISPRGALDPYLRRRSTIAKGAADLVWQRRLFDGAALIHLTSEEEARQIADIAPSVARAVVPNGVRWEDYGALPPPTAFGRRYLGGSEAPVVLFLGRVSRKKGLDVLVRAFAAASRTGMAEPWLVIAGPDDEGLTRSLRALAARNGVGGRTVFTGMLSGVDKLSALAAADVWVLPSRGENFGNAVVEALAASRAVVVSQEVNIAQAIAEAGAGVVVERSVDAVAGRVAALLRDNGARAELGSAARAFARRYDWANVARQLVEMYERAASHRAAA